MHLKMLLFYSIFQKWLPWKKKWKENHQGNHFPSLIKLKCCNCPMLGWNLGFFDFCFNLPFSNLFPSLRLTLKQAKHNSEEVEPLFPNVCTTWWKVTLGSANQNPSTYYQATLTRKSIFILGSLFSWNRVNETFKRKKKDGNKIKLTQGAFKHIHSHIPAITHKCFNLKIKQKEWKREREGKGKGKETHGISKFRFSTLL